MNQAKTLVSVIIPTANRPHLVVRAVQSALAQTLDNIKVIVVIDGPDKITEDALKHGKLFRKVVHPKENKHA